MILSVTVDSFEIEINKLICEGVFCMNVSDLKTLKDWLDRAGSLPDYQRDLIENAIYCLDHGSSYRAEESLKTMARNYRNNGDSNAANAVERLL